MGFVIFQQLTAKKHVGVTKDFLGDGIIFRHLNKKKPRPMTVRAQKPYMERPLKDRARPLALDNIFLSMLALFPDFCRVNFIDLVTLQAGSN